MPTAANPPTDLGHQTIESMGRHRYGVVLGLLVIEVLYSVLAPEGARPRFVELGLQTLVLFIVIITSGYRVSARRWGAGALFVVVLASAGLAAYGSEPPWLLASVTSTLILLTVIELTRGMRRLLENSGVTVTAIAGGLAIYLLIGMLFAVVISVIASVESAHYFTQGTNGSTSDRVYYSFTTMTTVGFGDFTAATRPGKTVAVLEMLVGQIYLVTVISLLVARAPSRPLVERVANTSVAESGGTESTRAEG